MRKTQIIGALLITMLLVLGACAKPAEFKVVSLDVTPLEVMAGETVTITAVVENIGGSEGTYAVILTVDGVTVETKEVAVTPGSSKVVNFSLVKDTPGTYEIGIGELSSSLVVKERLVIKEVELKYDDGRPDSFWAIGRAPGTGHLVHFSPPTTPFTITKVKIYGTLYGTGYENLEFTVEIWDKEQKTIHSASYPHTKFTLYPQWVEIEVPKVVVGDSFYIHAFTHSPREGGVNIGYDSSVKNEHSEMTRYWKIEWWSELPKETVNWMIRVSGTYMPSSEPEPTPEPISEEIELKYDDGVARNYISVFPPLLTGYLVDFTPPHIPFTIKKVQMHGELSGSGWEGKNFEVEIWDKDRKVLYRATLPVTLFPQYPKHDWAEIEIPDIEVADKFYVHVYTGTGIGEGIHIGADDSISNEHSNVTVREGETDKQLDYWPYSPSVWFGDKSKVNWMIRVIGTAMLPPD